MSHRRSGPQFSHRCGFTLIELVITLLVIGVITGGAIAAMLAKSPERKLRNASSEIELLAKKARTASILHQTSYAIEFQENRVRLAPYVETLETERTTALGRSIGGEAVEQEGKPSIHQEITLDPDIALTIRRWNTSEFINPDESHVQIWRFDPDGLSEPISVRFSLGSNYTMDTYHPLTASIADTEMEAN